MSVKLNRRVITLTLDSGATLALARELFCNTMAEAFH